MPSKRIVAVFCIQKAAPVGVEKPRKLRIKYFLFRKNGVWFCTSKKITNFAPAISKGEHLARYGIVEFSTLKARACGEIGRRARLRI